MQGAPAKDHEHGEQGGEEASCPQAERGAREVFQRQGSRRRGFANIIQVSYLTCFIAYTKSKRDPKQVLR